MRPLLIKAVMMCVYGLVQFFGGKYLNASTGLMARRWVERHGIGRFKKWAKAGRGWGMPGNLVLFLQAFMKSNQIQDAIHDVPAPPEVTGTSREGLSTYMSRAGGPERFADSVAQKPPAVY